MIFANKSDPKTNQQQGCADGAALPIVVITNSSLSSTGDTFVHYLHCDSDTILQVEILIVAPNVSECVGENSANRCQFTAA